MSQNIDPERRHFVHDELLRSIGALSLALHHLEAIRRTTHCFPDGTHVTGWCEFADHLITMAHRVMQAAAAAEGKQRTVRVPIDQNRTAEIDSGYVGKLTQKVTLHTRTAHLLGYDKELVAERSAS